MVFIQKKHRSTRITAFFLVYKEFFFKVEDMTYYSLGGQISPLLLPYDYLVDQPLPSIHLLLFTGHISLLRPFPSFTADFLFKWGI